MYPNTLIICACLLSNVSASYVIWFFPDALISNLQATMLLPSVPLANTGIHYIWPGLQPSTNDYVFQDVAGDTQPDGKWTFAEWSVTSALTYNESAIVPVSPGDSIRMNFTLDTATNEWNDTWIIQPGAAGTTAGEVYSVGGVNENISSYGALTEFLFVIELQELATWNFGSLAFSNIVMEAETSATAWCLSPTITGAMNWTMSVPVVTSGTNTTRCEIESLVMVTPT